jgi:hypothetical protein
MPLLGYTSSVGLFGRHLLLMEKALQRGEKYGKRTKTAAEATTKKE